MGHRRKIGWRAGRHIGRPLRLFADNAKLGDPRRRLVALLLGLLALTACQAWTSPAQLGEKVSEGRRAFLAGKPIQARQIFREILETSPNRLGALDGFARSAARLHLYDEALPAFEKAIDVSVRDGQIWEAYVSALADAAFVRRDAKLLKTALEKGAAAIFLFPERIGTYHSLDKASSGLGDRAAYLKLLSELQGKLPQEPVLAAQLTALRLSIAREHGLQDTVSELSQQIQSRLELFESAQADPATLEPGQLFLVFSDYLAVGQESRAETLLPSLNQTPEGQRLTRSYRRRSVEEAVRQAVAVEVRLNLVGQALESFQPKWGEDDGDYWKLLALKFEVLEMALRGRFQRGQELPAGEITDLLDAGTTLASADTFNGAHWHVRTCQTLVDINQRLQDAVELAQTGISRLLERRPGLLYPARNEVETSTARRALVSDLQMVQAEAHLKSAQWPDAESLLRKVIESRPSAVAHALLARSLQAQGKLEEAYPEFVAALAEGFLDDQQVEAESTLAEARRTASQIGKSRHLDPDIERQRRRLAQTEEIRIVSERLDQETPNFELAGLDGLSWTAQSLRGSVAVLNFWATWCSPCLKEFPYYSQLVKEFSDRGDIVFLAVSIDDPGTPIHVWLEEEGYDFTAVYDNGAAADLQIEEIPATVIIDKQGKTQYRTVGFPGEKQYLREMRLRIQALAGE